MITKVLNEQLKLGIIEKIEPTNYKSHIWIPHRPVIRKDPLVLTTKFRSVFNFKKISIHQPKKTLEFENVLNCITSKNATGTNCKSYPVTIFIK